MEELRKITDGKRVYLPLLLLADPSEEMVNRYLPQGDFYVLFSDGIPVCEAVVIRLNAEECELKNLATDENHQKQGYAARMIHYLCEQYQGKFQRMLVGTSEENIVFYKNNGFRFSHVVKNFFTDYYPEPIYENGKQLCDMTYFVKPLN